MIEAKSYIKASHETRTVIRRMTCPDGYCLIVDDDLDAVGVVSEILSKAKMAVKVAGNCEDAIGILHQEAGRVICIVIGDCLDGLGGCEDMIREIERHFASVPYVVHLEDGPTAARLSSRFPRANIILKGSDIQALVESLGLK